MQFSLCTEETYNQLIDIFGIDKMEGFLIFEEVKKMNIRCENIFNLKEGHNKKSNVLKYKKDYEGFHPTQKPIALLKDLIKTYSNKGDKILDFAAGSFSTLVACKQLNREGIPRNSYGICRPFWVRIQPQPGVPPTILP